MSLKLQGFATFWNLINITTMALAIQPGTGLANQIETGEFIQAISVQILEEEKLFLQKPDNF